MQKTIKRISTLLSVTALSVVTLQPVMAADAETQIKERLQKMIGADASQAKIGKTEIDGLYQIQLGLTVVYMSADGKYLMNGNMIDLANDKNLTRGVQANTRKDMLATVPESGMIVYPAKNEKHQITVFTDVDCPYCKKLHKEIPALNEAGVTVRYLSYPRSGMNSKSYKEAVSIWCAKDRAQSMDDAMKGLPPEAQTCSNPVQEHMVRAQMFEVNGTPNMILDNGQSIPGYAPAREILKLLKES